MKHPGYLIFLILLLLSTAGEGAQYASAGSDLTLCPVHHVALKRERLKLVYGLVAGDPCDTLDLIDAREKYFPYANSTNYGGCVRDSNSPDYEEVMYCPKCREVEKSWPCLATRETPIVTKLPPPRVTKLRTVN